MSGGGFRVSIPNSVRKTIQNIKEITGNHSEEEIYAMLKECSMDPNETTQKLLLQDTFHEVKRKRDKRKENTSIKESAESRWRPNMQARGRGGRMSYSPRYVSHDAGGGKSSASGKESAINQVFERKIAIPPSPTSLEAKNKETTPVTCFVTVVADGLTTVDSGSTSATHATYLSKGSGVNQSEISSTVDISKLGNASPLPPSVTANKNHTIATGNGETPSQPTSNFGDNFASISLSSSSAVCFSSSDPVLVPSHDSHFPSAVGATILREVGSQRTPDAIEPTESKLAAGTSASKSQGVGKIQFTESSPHFPSGAHGGTSVSRSSSNYNIRSQPVIGPQKAVGPNKEWKPKPTNPSPAQGSGTTIAPEVPNVLVEAGGTQSMSTSSVPDLEESTSKVQRKFAELHIQDHRHVIIPNHIHVPESERSGLSFGSIDASFGVSINYGNGYESDKSSTALSETSHGVEETMEEQPSSNHDAFATAEEGDYCDHSQSPRHVPENLSSIEGDVVSAVAPDYNESKQEVSLPHGGQQYSVVHTLPNYSFGFVPPMLGSQVAPFENSESQARDASRHPSFLAQQPFDPSSYYAQFYRSSADSDGRLSPFPSPGVAPKYNGNMALLSAQTSQSPQEGGNSLVMSTAGPTPLVTQAGGIMQSSIAATQQPLPVFRPPTGLHISHYPPSYVPYGHYISPFYVPPPAIHQFLSSGAFPQQPQAGSMYAAPAAAAATGVKYSLSQFKAGSNAGNSTHIAMPGGYGPYGSSPAGYNPSSASTGGNSTSNEDLAASQFKESNIYIPGQQNEGSGVWITAPSRDISSLPASSFYNLAHQGQHVPFAPQAGHGTFTNVYHHPAQAVTAATVHPLLQQSQTMAGAIEMVGPTAGVYQQPQHAQMNWPNNY